MSTNSRATQRGIQASRTVVKVEQSHRSRPYVAGWRVQSSGEVKACRLYLSDNVGLVGEWRMTETGKEVMVNLPHSEYYTSEGEAYAQALRRATDTYEHHKRLAENAHTKQLAAFRAIAAFNERERQRIK